MKSLIIICLYLFIIIIIFIYSEHIQSFICSYIETLLIYLEVHQTYMNTTTYYKVLTDDWPLYPIMFFLCFWDDPCSFNEDNLVINLQLQALQNAMSWSSLALDNQEESKGSCSHSGRYERSYLLFIINSIISRSIEVGYGMGTVVPKRKNAVDRCRLGTTVPKLKIDAVATEIILFCFF